MKNIIKIVVLVLSISILGSCYSAGQCVQSPAQEYENER